ncbi:MAG: hypothetical protein HZC54_19990 [Verrucomicrobia bacterium]|nr:hypothetical protein [Verrucomicrobiota bacterium]
MTQFSGGSDFNASSSPQPGPARFQPPAARPLEDTRMMAMGFHDRARSFWGDAATTWNQAAAILAAAGAGFIVGNVESCRSGVICRHALWLCRFAGAYCGTALAVMKCDMSIRFAKTPAPGDAKAASQPVTPPKPDAAAISRPIAACSSGAAAVSGSASPFCTTVTVTSLEKGATEANDAVTSLALDIRRLKVSVTKYASAQKTDRMAYSELKKAYTLMRIATKAMLTAAASTKKAIEWSEKGIAES